MIYVCKDGRREAPLILTFLGLPILQLLGKFKCLSFVKFSEKLQNT